MCEGRKRNERSIASDHSEWQGCGNKPDQHSGTQNIGNCDDHFQECQGSSVIPHRQRKSGSVSVHLVSVLIACTDGV